MSIPNRLAYLGWENFGISANDIVWGTLQCAPKQVLPLVVLAPWWSSSIFRPCRVETIADGIAKVDNLTCGDLSFTMIRTGIGAPLAGDATIALGCTPCTHIVFVGSVGGLDATQKIGDLAIPDRSYSGDGFSMYLPKSTDGPHPQLLQSVTPDQRLRSLLTHSSQSVSRSNGVAVHTGSVFSIDTILAQFQHLDWIVDQLHCIGIEMETSAVFRAAQLCGIKAAALLQFSDVIPARKSLYSGRTEVEQEHRRQVRTEILAPAVIDVLSRIGEAEE